jgi:hypothetical protein
MFSASLPVKPGEEEGNLDALAVSVVEKSLEIFNLISNVFKNSTRAGGHVSLKKLVDKIIHICLNRSSSRPIQNTVTNFKFKSRIALMIIYIKKKE